MAMTIRPDDDLQRALRELADASHTSMQEVVRTAVLEKWQREGHRARVVESGERLAERWSDVLERLGSV